MMKIRTQELPRRASSTQVKAYVRAVEMGQKTYHLMQLDGKWIVKKALATKSTKVFDRKDTAAIFAKDLAKTHKTELVIHGADGRIQDRLSYAM